MAEERVVEHPDGTVERTINRDGGTTVVERGGSGAGWLIGIVLLIAVLIGAWYLLTQSASQSARNNAIAGAAKSVGSAADKVGDAVSN